MGIMKFHFEIDQTPVEMTDAKCPDCGACWALDGFCTCDHDREAIEALPPVDCFDPVDVREIPW